ncbi:MAG: FCSD flavin-binding domain-containing protein, partial [Magnetospirillum sp.]|nr:FCSD flavin-binding domain-containing protein [Magnetospirillum sp.]
GRIETDHHRFQPAVANIIPPQTANSLVQTAELTDHTGFCPVDSVTMRSTMARDIFIIGDAAKAGEMPKTAHAASSQAKIAAAAVAADLAGQGVGPFSAVNATYALVAPDWGFSITGVYDGGSGEIAMVKNSGGASPINAGLAYRRREAELAEGWYRSICADSWGQA